MTRPAILACVLALVFAEVQAADPLAGIPIAPEVDADYDRERDYGGWDREGCATVRHRVLAAESLAPVLWWPRAPRDCRVVSGLWYDPYTARVFTDPAALDVDHVVPLAEAHDSGAHAWPQRVREAYANDTANPGHLIAVERGANRAKGADDPADWLPPNEAFHCAYVLAWIGVKREWGLAMDRREAAAVRGVLDGCEQGSER